MQFSWGYCRLVNNQSKTENQKSKTQNPKSKIDIVLVPLIFIPRLLNLDVFLTPDEPLMLNHAREFMAGLTGGDFSRTLGIGWPGVTVAGWSAPVVGLASTELGAYVAGRMVTAAITGLLLLMIYRLARLLLGRGPALIGVGLLALDPYSLAYSRLLHIAAPLALFMTLAGLAFLLWLRDTDRRWLLLTGLFTGLALLTKSTALLLGPMLGVAMLSWGIFTGQGYHRAWWLRKIANLLIIAIVAVAVFFVFWPAMWTNPAQTISHTFQRLFTDQQAGTGNLGLFWFGRFVEDPGPLFYPVAFLLKSTPWLLAGLLLSLIQTFTDTLQPTTQNHQSPITNHQSPIPQSKIQNPKSKIVPLWFFALTYLIIMTIASKKSIRYMLPAFPTFYLLAGLAFHQTAKTLRSWKPGIFLPFTPAPLPPCTPALVSKMTLPITLALIIFTYLYHPYYFTYYNPLLLGWRWAPQTLLVGWGEGLDGAARYLNNQPERSVSAWYEHLFSVLYDGETQPVVPQENLITANRTVLYINQAQRDIPSPNIIHYFRARRQPEHTVRLSGIDYAWVYPGPIAGFRPDPAPQYPLGGKFGNEMSLLGYDLLRRSGASHTLSVANSPNSPNSPDSPNSPNSQTHIAGGDTLIATLYWRVLTVPPADRFVYLRLVDSRGRIWTKADSPPVMGLWPPARWQPDMLIEDAHELPISPGTPPGAYRLEIGLYDPDAGQPLAAAGQPLGQGGGLLLGKVEVEWQSLSAQADLPYQTDTRLAPNARLTGYTLPPPTAVTGDLIPIRLAWREDQTFSSFISEPFNNLVKFEWRQNGQYLAEQLDPLPLPIAQWGRGALALSQHDLIVPPALVSGRYELAVMLHNGSDPAGDAFLLGTVEVTALPHNFKLPEETLSPSGQAQLTAESGQTIQLSGYTINRSDQSLKLNLYWQSDAVIATGYKVFAQLLNADNTLAAQSDSLPAAGQRPTTGWLPNEIIVDSHRLSLPDNLPTGSYRLITGFYNPLNGRRLPILNQAGQIIADAIFVAEVTLP